MGGRWSICGFVGKHQRFFYLMQTAIGSPWKDHINRVGQGGRNAVCGQGRLGPHDAVKEKSA